MEHTAATAPAADPIDLKVNGAAARVAVAPATPLLLVLRNDLALNGPKYGCGLGECGACEMLVEAFRTSLSENEVGCEVCTGGMLNMATYGIAAKQNRFRLIDAGAVVELKRVKVQSMRTRENIAHLFQLLGADGTHHHVPGDSRN